MSVLLNGDLANGQLTNGQLTNGHQTNGHLAYEHTSKTTKGVSPTTSTAGEEIILKVDKAVATFSLGYSIDAGGSLLKLVYRSKEDYENGIPKDVNCRHGKLRLRVVKYTDADALLEFLRLNCDILEISRRKSVDEPDKLRLWHQTGANCQQLMKKIDESLQIRTSVLNELRIQRSALCGFYTNSASSTGFKQRLLPLSTQSVDRARRDTIKRNNILDVLKAIGEKPFGQLMKREQTTFDVTEYRTKLETIDAAELAAEMSLIKIEYPSIHVVIGSVMIMSLIEADETMSIVLDLLPLSAKSFVNIGLKLTGAKDFHELIEMIERGNHTKVDTMAIDQKFQDTTENRPMYDFAEDDVLFFALGKLCDDKFKGTYTNDDIAAAWMLAFCTNTAKLLTMYCLLNDVTSVLISGSFISHPTTRHCLEKCFMRNSLNLPFSGGKLIRMTSLPNPGFVGALGTWYYNWENEQEEIQKQKDVDQ